MVVPKVDETAENLAASKVGLMVAHLDYLLVELSAGRLAAHSADLWDN